MDQTLLSVVQESADFKHLSPVQQAVVILLFIHYENTHAFTTEDVHMCDSVSTRISDVLTLLYYPDNVPKPSYEPHPKIAKTILLIDDDELFKSCISGNDYLIAMDAIKVLHDNLNLIRAGGGERLPTALPATVLPPIGPNPWVAEEERLTDLITADAYNAADAVEYAKKHDNIIAPKLLKDYIDEMQKALQSTTWKQLEIHAKKFPDARRGYNENKQFIENSLNIALEMKRGRKRLQHVSSTRVLRSDEKKRSRSRSPIPKGGTKRRSKSKHGRFTRRMRKQQYRRRTLNRR
jgi:hypothetical protein